MFSLSKKRWQWAAMLLLAFIWGCSFILMKKGLVSFTYIQVASIRIFLSFLILIPFAIRSFRKINSNNYKFLAISGIIGNLLPAYLFTFAQTNLSSSVAGILNSLSPFFTLMVGIAIFKNRPGILQYVGIFIGLIGAVLLISNGNFSSFKDINLYALLIVFATLLYGTNSNVISHKLVGLSGIEITSLAFMFIGPFAGIVLFSTDLSPALNSPHFGNSLLAIIALAVFGSVLSLFVYNSLIHHTSALFATSVTYIMPIFALMWGVLDGESLGILQIVSMLVILFGVYLVNSRLLKSKIQKKASS